MTLIGTGDLRIDLYGRRSDPNLTLGVKSAAAAGFICSSSRYWCRNFWSKNATKFSKHHKLVSSKARTEFFLTLSTLQELSNGTNPNEIHQYLRPTGRRKGIGSDWGPFCAHRGRSGGRPSKLRSPSDRAQSPLFEKHQVRLVVSKLRSIIIS